MPLISTSILYTLLTKLRKIFLKSYLIRLLSFSKWYAFFNTCVLKIHYICNTALKCNKKSEYPNKFIQQVVFNNYTRHIHDTFSNRQFSVNIFHLRSNLTILIQPVSTIVDHHEGIIAPFGDKAEVNTQNND